MKSKLQKKLLKISNIWHTFIWKYKSCPLQKRFLGNIKTNYLGDIFGYFDDTLGIIYSNHNTTSSFINNFNKQVGLLQSIYLQQDFIEELLRVFKCNLDKGILKNDSNYSINREIRNELIGHPIRIISGELISSTLFGYHPPKNNILYLRYHKDNNFEFESISHNIKDIKARHTIFLNTYFDIILSRAKVFLDEFIDKIMHIEMVLNNKSFETVLKLVDLYFNDIFESDNMYDKKSLIYIYKKKNSHIRYSNFIQSFYLDIKTSIEETKSYIESFITPIKKDKIQQPFNVMINFVENPSIKDSIKNHQQKTYHYEISKLSSKHDITYIKHIIEYLEKAFYDKPIILDELHHMKLNLNNNLEYYCSLKLISSILETQKP